MAVTDYMAMANDKGFQRKIKYYMQKAAIAIIGGDSETAGHVERVEYAKKILSGAASIYEFAVAVVTN